MRSPISSAQQLDFHKVETVMFLVYRGRNLLRLKYSDQLKSSNDVVTTECGRKNALKQIHPIANSTQAGLPCLSGMCVVFSLECVLLFRLCPVCRSLKGVCMPGCVCFFRAMLCDAILRLAR